jgi:chorismate mutase
MRVRAARGPSSSPETTQNAARRRGRLLQRWRTKSVDRADLISILFTVTDDLRSGFPARLPVGWTWVSCRSCAQEIPVEGSIPSVVRILAHFHSGLVPGHRPRLDGASRCAMTSIPLTRSAERIAVIGTGLIGTSIAMASVRWDEVSGGITTRRLQRAAERTDIRIAPFERRCVTPT